MTPDEIHTLLAAEAKRRTLPKCYVNDVLVHDLNWLHDYGSTNFIWILRTCGSFAFPLDCMDDVAHCKLRMIDTHYALRNNWPDNLLKYEYGGGDDEVYYYHFSDTELKEITQQQAYEIGKASVARHLAVIRLRSARDIAQAELDRAEQTK